MLIKNKGITIRGKHERKNCEKEIIKNLIGYSQVFFLILNFKYVFAKYLIYLKE